MADFDTSRFDQGVPETIEVLMDQFGVQSKNAYRRIIEQLNQPIGEWPEEVLQYVLTNARLEALTHDDIMVIQSWQNYETSFAMICLGRLVARFFGHTPPA